MAVVEARFICESKTVIDQTSVSVTLRAAITGQDNKTWAPYTPSGSLTMTVNGAAAGEFEQDARYELLIRKVGPGE